MLKNDIYNIYREFDYAAVKTIVLKSLIKIAKEEALMKRLNVSNDFMLGYDRVGDNHNNVIDAPLPWWLCCPITLDHMYYDVDHMDDS